MAEAPPGGPGPSGWANRWAARIWRTASGSSTVAITRSRPPQFGQANTSIANARTKTGNPERAASPVSITSEVMALPWAGRVESRLNPILF